jgi:hypothetical protein
VTPSPQPGVPQGATVPGFVYQLYDLRSGAYLGRLPLNGVSFGSQLLTPGTCSGTIDIASPAVQALGPLTLTQPGRTMLAVDYLGALVWAGIIWTRAYKFQGPARVLSITATEIWSYFQQREQATDYSAPPYSGLTGTGAEMAIWDATLTSVPDGGPGVYDPVLIAWQVLSDALTQVSYGNLLGGMSIAANSYTTTGGYLASGTATPSSEYLSVNYPYASLQQVHQIVNLLATNGVGVGFDYAVDVAYSGQPGSVPVGTVNLSYPRRGRTAAQNQLALNTGACISYEIPEDATQIGNTVYEQGSSGSLVVSQNANPLNAGYPVLEQIKSRSSIQSANMLNVLTALGITDLFTGSYPVATPSVTVDLFTGSVPLGSFIVGDNVRWIVPASDGTGGVFDPRLPNGLDEEWRIVGYNADVKDEGQSTLTLQLAQPPLAIAAGPSV